MSLVILITLLLLSSWLFSEVLVLVPIDLLNTLNTLKPFTSLTLALGLLAFLWCFGGE